MHLRQKGQNMETLLPIIFASADIVSTVGTLAALAIAGLAVAVMIWGSQPTSDPSISPR